MSLILAVLPHFTIAPALARKQIHAKWPAENAFPQNLAFKWEKTLKKLAPKVIIAAMQLSNHDLSQLDEEELLKLPEEALRRLSIQLLKAI